MANPYVKQTWTDGAGGGTPLSAARLAVIEQGVYDAHIAPAVRATHSATQSISTGTETTLAFNSESYDQDGLGTSLMHDNSTFNSRLTAKVAGIYHIEAEVPWAANGTGSRYAYILKDGATAISHRDIRKGEASFDIVCRPSAEFILAVNNYVELRVQHDSGGALNVQAGANFWMHRVG